MIGEIELKDDLELDQEEESFNMQEENKSQKIEKFRMGLLASNTRRFGTAAEILVRKRYGFNEVTKSQHHDATGKDGKRIEIKFSRALEKNTNIINENNLLEEMNKAAVPTDRSVHSKDRNVSKFDSNIQQVKRVEFDELYYGLFFEDKIAVFSMDSKVIQDAVDDFEKNLFGYSDKQHKNNVGEGQFHLKSDTIDYHIDNHLKEWVTYEDFYDMLNAKEINDDSIKQK